MKSETTVLYLDHYHLEDMLFLESLARRLASFAGQDIRYVILHGAGDEADRMLEQEGVIPRRDFGALSVDDSRHQGLIERAIRHTGQRLVGILSDRVVPAVSMHGSDKGLLKILEGNSVRFAGRSMAEAIIRQNVVLIVSSLVRDEGSGEIREWNHGMLLEALAKGLGSEVVFFTASNRPGIHLDGSSVDTMSIAKVVKTKECEAVDVMKYLLENGVSVLVSGTAGLEPNRVSKATRITA